MGCVCVVLAKSAEDDVADILRTMTGAVSYGHLERSTFVLGSQVGFAEVPVGNAAFGAVWDRSRRFLGSFNGRLDNIDDFNSDSREIAAGSPAGLVMNEFASSGSNTYEKLLGDFTLVVWDSWRRILHFGRDYYGVKPLFWAENARHLFLSSDIAAFRQLPVDLNPDEEGVADLLAGDLFNRERSFYRGIRRVRPSHEYRFRDGVTSSRRYWALERKPSHLDDKSAIGEFTRLFNQSLRARIQPSEYTGVELSGGLDSTSIAAWGAPLSHRLTAFSLTYPGLNCDESRYSSTAALKFRIPHITVPYRVADGADYWRQSKRAFDFPDHPTVTSSSLPAVAFSRGCTSMLSGVGGDDWLDRAPALAEDAERLMHGRLPRERRLFSVGMAAFRYLAAEGANGIGRRAFGRGLSSLQARVPWLSPHLVGIVYEHIDEYFASTAYPFSPAATYQMRLGLAPYQEYAISSVLDRYYAAKDLQPSYPFLDRRMVEFLFNIEADLKSRDQTTKYILREAGAHVLPDIIRGRDDKAEFTRVVVDGIEALGGVNFIRGMTAVGDLGWVNPQLAGDVYHDQKLADVFSGGDLWRLWFMIAAEIWLQNL